MLNDHLIYTTTARYAVVDGALYQEHSRGLKPLLFEVTEEIMMPDDSVIMRGESFHVAGAERTVDLGVVTHRLFGVRRHVG
jgi:hypothetical protein